ncbi:MAG: hypothetical protein JSV98_05745 [candidate division WOR-3 bacterium]|nr:MAG: hypothetical protein JSV98_05745 [candidate division WOR-3 bacterium]
MALKIIKRLGTYKYLFLWLLFILSCQKQDRIAILAEYLKEEKRLRENESSAQALRDSLKLLEEKYKIDRNAELRKLAEDPGEWVDLLKELKRVQ